MLSLPISSSPATEGPQPDGFSHQLALAAQNVNMKVPPSLIRRGSEAVINTNLLEGGLLPHRFINDPLPYGGDLTTAYKTPSVLGLVDALSMRIEFDKNEKSFSPTFIYDANRLVSDNLVARHIIQSENIQDAPQVKTFSELRELFSSRKPKPEEASQAFDWVVSLYNKNFGKKFPDAFAADIAPAPKTPEASV